MSHSFAVQTALFQALSAALGARTPSVPVYDLVPPNAAYPYVEISRFIARPDNTFTGHGTLYQVTLSIYSDYEGQKEVHDLHDAIYAALDDVLIPTSEGVVWQLNRDFADTVRDQDGRTYMGTAIYHVFTRH